MSLTVKQLREEAERDAAKSIEDRKAAHYAAVVKREKRKDERALNRLSKPERKAEMRLRSLEAKVRTYTVGSSEIIPLRTKSGGSVELPVGATVNDILRWDGSKWVIFAAPATTGNFFLTVQTNVMTWQEIATTCA